jgi:hypothetical protein
VTGIARRPGWAVNDHLSVVLRRVRDGLAPLDGRIEAARGALDLLDRDLLPRTAGGDAYLVAGIVGPNNAGKSALFNALIGRELSPSLPAGGATRRLVGAAHPRLLERLAEEPTLARFRLRKVSEERPSEEALQAGTDPSELLVHAEPRLPESVMLIDTPDFDSILVENRLASQSLLAVADLVVAVVTRHSYQNREVVHFLHAWLAHGRPWLLVYNEATKPEVARAHCEKLAADVGTKPLAVFWAPHSLAIQQRTAPLAPRLLAPHARPDDGTQSLGQFLLDAGWVEDVKRQAFAAALGRLAGAIEEVRSDLKGSAALARSVVADADARAYEAGLRIASKAMPARPFVEAFRAVLDRRSNPLSRSWRASLRRVRVGLEAIPALVTGGGRRADSGEAAASLAAIEKTELAAVWPAFWEELARDLGPEARSAARRSSTPDIARSLDREVDESEREAAFRRAEESMTNRPADVEAFREACETLVEDAIRERGFDLDIQLAADIATLMPLALAAVVIVHTAGLGSDIAAAGGGALSTFLIEKYSHLLGAGVLARARRRWSELRGRQLADLLIDAVLPVSAPRLRGEAEENVALAARLADLAGAVAAWSKGHHRRAPPPLKKGDEGGSDK